MTNREFFEAITKSAVSTELKEFAANAITKLDARNAKRASKPSKTAIANEPIKANIVAFLSDKTEPMIAKVIGENLGITTMKASTLCTKMKDEGVLTAVDVKIKGKGTVKGYLIAK